MIIICCVILAGGVASARLLQVEVQTQSATTCTNIYGSEYVSSTMICAGPLAGGEDACQVGYVTVDLSLLYIVELSK